MDEEETSIELPHELNRTVDMGHAMNALSISPNGEFAVVAGREILKILKVGDEEGISEAVNLRSGTRINLNLSCSDVKWAPSYSRQNLIATSATNGAVVIWDLGKAGLNKQDRILTDHSRAVNRITFHPTEAILLLSASQDGTMRLWDLRVKSSVMTFEGKSESARDVQFAPNSTTDFAAAFENGNIQKWDMRSPKMFEKKLSAHNGLVLTLDWHPDGRYLASGGRDKVIKFWDMNSDARKPFHHIQTIASVARVIWKPKTSTFNSLSSTSPPSFTSFDNRNFISSCSLLTDNRIHVWNIDRPYVPDKSFEEHSNVVTGFLWKSPNVIWSVSKDKYFVIREYADGFTPTDYISSVGTTWNMWGDLYSLSKKTNKTFSLSNFTVDEAIFLNQQQQLQSSMKSSLNEGSPAPTQVGSWRGSTVPNITTFLQSLSQEDPRWNLHEQLNVSQNEKSLRDSMSGDDDSFKVGVSSYFTRRLPRKQNTSLNPNRRKEIRLNLFDPEKYQACDYFDSETVDSETFMYLANYSKLRPVEQQEGTEDVCKWNSDLAEDMGCIKLAKTWLILRNAIELARVCEDKDAIDVDRLIMETINWYINKVSVIMALVFRNNIKISERLKETMYAYIELLSRAELFVKATEIIKESPFAVIQRINQESTTIHTTCHRCMKPIIPEDPMTESKHWYCGKCRNLLNPCSICNLPVKSLYVWCRGCSHGGHADHMREWFKQSPKCPTGCGHLCTLSPIMKKSK